MRLLGLSFGRKMANTEVLVKEAMMAAEEAGVEVGMIRILDLDIKPCQGCISCARSLMSGGSGECAIKDDDFHFLDEEILASDGIILGAPVYVLGPTGLLKIISDRMGPSHDMTSRLEARKINQSKGSAAPKGPDERSFKRRVAGFISMGGAATPHWLSLGLPLMNLFTFSSQIAVVDQMQVIAAGQYRNIVLNDEALARARLLGRHVAEAMLDSAEEVKWMGDEMGTCPVCHSNLLTVKQKNPVECPICGIEGELSMAGDEIKVTFSESEKQRSRLTLAGKLEHWNELLDNLDIMLKRPESSTIPQKLEKYKGYREIKPK